MAPVLEEWSAVSRVFHGHRDRSSLKWSCSACWTLRHPCSAIPSQSCRCSGGARVLASRQRLDAVAVLAERESRLSALQRLALVDAAASWLSVPNGGDQLAHALFAAVCMTEVTAEHAYLALITPADNPDDHFRGPAFVVANPVGRAPPVQAHA